MQKLLNLIFEEVNIPPNELIELTNYSPELKQIEKDIVELVNKAYDHVGGHGNFKNIYKFDTIFIADTDNDNKPNVALLGSKTKNGTIKLSVFATDSSPNAKKMLLSSAKEILNKLNVWAELPYEFAKFLKSRGLPILENEEKVKLLLGKRVNESFVWLGNGFYSKSYFGTTDKRAIIGNIDEEIFNTIKKFNSQIP
jgi:hypothetical protein